MPSQQEYDPEVHLSFQDLAVDSRHFPTVLQITLRQSKTDPFRQGVTLTLGKTASTICPVNKPYYRIWP